MMLPCAHISGVTATLQQIHKDPTILDRAIAAKVNLEITSRGQLIATMVPVFEFSQEEEARHAMKKMFANPTWQFEIGTPMNRDERNLRG
jgi:hypothetical protein